MNKIRIREESEIIHINRFDGMSLDDFVEFANHLYQKHEKLMIDQALTSKITVIPLHNGYSELWLEFWRDETDKEYNQRKQRAKELP